MKKIIMYFSILMSNCAFLWAQKQRAYIRSKSSN